MTNQIPTFREIVTAIQTNDETVIKKLQALIDAKPHNVNMTDSNAVTLLHYAAESGNIEVVRFLLANGAKSWGIKNDARIGSVEALQGYTPLHLAAKNGHRDIVQYLLNAGVEASARTRWRGVLRGDTPSDVAKNEQIEQLIQNSRDYNFYSIVRDLKNNDFEQVVQKINAGVCLSDTDNLGNTMPHLAAVYANEKVWQALLQTGTNLNFQNEMGRTPLHLAMETQSVAVLKLIISNHANLNIVDKEGKTPLVFALSQNELRSEDNILCLINEGADVNIPDESGLTALHYASYKGNISIIQSLISHGADVNAKANFGTTPIHEAVYGHHLEAVVCLINQGADISLVNKEGKTPLQMSQQEVISQRARKNGRCSADTLGIEYVLKAREQTDNASDIAYISLKQSLENKHFVTAEELIRVYKEQNILISTEREQELLGLVGDNAKLKNALSEISLLAYSPSEENFEETRTPPKATLELGKVEVPPVEFEPNIEVHVEVQTMDIASSEFSSNELSEIAPEESEKDSDMLDLGIGLEGTGEAHTDPDLENKNKVSSNQGVKEEEAESRTSDREPEKASDVSSQASEPSNQIQVIRHQYGDLGDDESRMDHSEALAFAKGRNLKRLDYRRKGRRNRNRETPYQTAINNIRRMEEQGLLPKGPNGESNADVYLYRLYQARQFYHPQEYLMTEEGEYRRVCDLFRSGDGKSLNRVYSNLIAKDLTDAQLEAYAVTLLTAERCIDNKGHDRARHRDRIKERFSYRPGKKNDIEETKTTIQKKLNQAGEVVPEYTKEGIGKDKRVALILSEGKVV